MFNFVCMHVQLACVYFIFCLHVCAMSIRDVDVDKDGDINAHEFDYLCEKVASMPCRFAVSPSWAAEYGGSIEKRIAARKAMLDAEDNKQGAARY